MKIYRDEFVLRTCNCDFQGAWRPSAILETMQEAAGMHSEILGCGREPLLKQNAVWVLTRSEVQMDRYPGVGETVCVETFPMPNRRCFFPRYYLFKTDKGEVLGKAATLWVLLDPVSRKMLPPGGVADLIPDNSDLTPPMGMPATVEAVEGEKKIFSRLPAYTDLDVNQHVNNTRYADWACDALGIDCMREKCLASMQVNYHAEVLPGQEITLHAVCSGENYQVSGYREDKLHFEIGGRLTKRK